MINATHEVIGLKEAIALLKVQLAEAQTNAAFYKCCALSGEIPTDGSEPFQPEPKETVYG